LDSKFDCRLAASQSFQLREDEPHPVGAFSAGAEFGADLLVHGVLGVYEALELVGVDSHDGFCGPSAAKADLDNKPLIASVNRCATQSQRFSATSEEAAERVVWPRLGSPQARMHFRRLTARPRSRPSRIVLFPRRDKLAFSATPEAVSFPFFSGPA